MRTDHSGKSYSVKEATIKLMQYCAYRDRSQKEVEDKLLTMRMIPQAREEIIIKLMQEGFLNEERFARSFARGKFRIKKWGRKRIQQELRIREISEPLIRMAMEEIDPVAYTTTAHQLAEKKLESIRETNPQRLRKKLADHLIQKGYETDLVYDIIRSLTQS